MYYFLNQLIFFLTFVSVHLFHLIHTIKLSHFLINLINLIRAHLFIVGIIYVYCQFISLEKFQSIFCFLARAPLFVYLNFQYFIIRQNFELY